MLTSSTKIYQLINQPLYFPFSLLLFQITLITNNHRNLWFSGKTLELKALHEPSQAKAVFWNCSLSTQQLFCYQRQPQLCSTRTAFLKHRAWVAYTAFPKTADRHSPETHRPDHMEAVYFQDSAVPVHCQFYWTWTSSSQNVPAQFSPKPQVPTRLQAHRQSSQTQTGHSCPMLHFS